MFGFASVCKFLYFFLITSLNVGYLPAYSLLLRIFFDGFIFHSIVSEKISYFFMNFRVIRLGFHALFEANQYLRKIAYFYIIVEAFSVIFLFKINLCYFLSCVDS